MALSGKLITHFVKKFLVEETENLLEIVKANPEAIDGPIATLLVTQIAKIHWSALVIVILSKFLSLFKKKKK